MKTKRISLFIATIFILQLFFTVGASAAQVDGNYITSSGACVMDYETGDILYQYNGYNNRSPASMTKLMSLYCIFEALENKGISYNTVVPISARAHSMPVTTDLQCIPLYYDRGYTVHQLIGAVATFSAANAVIALVEFVAGSEKEFVKIMNSTAKRMGLNATYYDACGAATNSISPVSMAHLARNIITDYPQIIDYTSKSSITFNGSKYSTTNKLLTTYYYDGAEGLKTGTSSTAGACFCGTAVRSGERVITVTMGSSGGNTRFTDTISLMNYGFKRINQLYPEKLCCAYSKIYMNGYKIPALEYMNKGISKPVIFIEDLQNYGFDVTYDDNSRVLKAVINPNKEIKPLASGEYDGKYGTKMARASLCKDVTVIINNGVFDITMDTVYLSKNKHAVYVEEFGNIFNLYWNGETSETDIVYTNYSPRGNDCSFVSAKLKKSYVIDKCLTFKTEG